ncbi:hypothetical protein F5877DRAFT_86243, partial [Lentinula edodes]
LTQSNLLPSALVPNRHLEQLKPPSLVVRESFNLKDRVVTKLPLLGPRPPPSRPSSSKPRSIPEITVQQSAAAPRPSQQDIPRYASLRQRGLVVDSSLKPGLILPATAGDSEQLLQWWPTFRNEYPPMLSLPRYSSITFTSLPTTSLASRGKNPQVTTFYPHVLAYWYQTGPNSTFSTAEAYHLYRALAFIQRAVIGTFESPTVASRADTFPDDEKVRAMVQREEIRHSFDHFRNCWYQRRNCPAFAMLFVALFCDFCETCLSPVAYRRFIYDETTKLGLGLSQQERVALQPLKGLYRVTTLGLPLPLDTQTCEGQLLLAVDIVSIAPKITHPLSDDPVVPDWEQFPLLEVEVESAPSDCSSSSEPLIDQLEVEEGRGGGEEPASDLEDTDTSLYDEPFASKAKGSSSSKVKASKSRKSLPSKKITASKGKRRRSSKSRDEESPAPPSKRAREHSPPVDAATAKDQKHSPKPSADSTTRQTQARLGSQTNYLTNPDFVPGVPFSSFKRDDSVNKRPEAHLLRLPKWPVAKEMQSFGQVVHMSGVGFTLPDLSVFAHLLPRFPSISATRFPVSDEVPNPCVSCILRGKECQPGSQFGGICLGCERIHRTCTAGLNLHEQGTAFSAIYHSLAITPPAFRENLVRTEKALELYQQTHQALATAQVTESLARVQLVEAYQALKTAGTDPNVVLSNWAEANPDVPVDYEIMTFLATLFEWPSSCNLSHYFHTDAGRRAFATFQKGQQRTAPSVVEAPTGPSISALEDDRPGSEMEVDAQLAVGKSDSSEAKKEEEVVDMLQV